MICRENASANPSNAYELRKSGVQVCAFDVRLSL